MAARHWPSPIERILTRVEPQLDGCWLYIGGYSGAGGHVRLSVNRRKEQVHRVAFEALVGPIPEGLVVRHTCDVPRCVNPDHLLPGTIADNVRDCVERGRKAVLRGSANARSKLTEDEVREIRRLATGGVKQRDIAARFGVNQRLVWGIAHGDRWAHLDADAAA